MIKYLILLFLTFLFGCSDFKKGLGFEKDVPDEFLIKKIDPIQKPPNYDLLPPDSKDQLKKTKKSKTNESVKNIIDNSLKSKTEISNQDTTKTSTTEKMILDQLEKNDTFR